MSSSRELLKSLEQLRATWKGFNVARGERNLTRIMAVRSERLQSDPEALRRDLQYWQLLADDNFKHRYPFSGSFPVPKWGNSQLLNEQHQLKMSKRIRSRLVNVVSTFLGDPVSADGRGGSDKAASDKNTNKSEQNDK